MTAEEYFVRVIKGFIYDDISALVNWQADKAGPLLMETVNGIDALGGLLYGFRKPDRSLNNSERIKRVIAEKMGLPEYADLICTALRNPVTHEGAIPGICYSKDTHPFSNFPFSRTGGGCICLHVGTLAQMLLDAIDELDRNREPSKWHSPFRPGNNHNHAVSGQLYRLQSDARLGVPQDGSVIRSHVMTRTDNRIC